MKSTTIKLSVETRERLRSLGGDTYETTIIAALDVLEADRFWSQVDVASAHRNALDPSDRARMAEHEAEVDATFNGVE